MNAHFFVVMTILVVVYNFLLLAVHALPRPLTSSEEIWPEELGNKFEGDIVLKSGEVKNGTVNYTRSVWPEARVVYKLDPSFNEREKRVIWGAMDEIREQTCVEFKEKTGEESFVDILRGESGSNSGCWSNLGYHGGRQDLNLQSDLCIHHGIIIHQLLHTLGLVHETTRNDRDDYVDIHWNCIKTGAAVNFGNWSSVQLAHFDLPYDYESIMHFPGNAFATNKSHPTVVTKDPYVEIGERRHLSSGDVKKIQKMYNTTLTCIKGQKGLGGIQQEVLKELQTSQKVLIEAVQEIKAELDALKLEHKKRMEIRVPKSIEKSISRLKDIETEALALATEIQRDFVCPQNSTIAPCTCKLDQIQMLGQISCQGEMVTLDILANLFLTLRSINNINPDEILQLHSLDIKYTKLKTLDLTPFLHTKFNQLSFELNTKLTSITGPSNSNQNSTLEVTPRSIQVDKLRFYYNYITDSALGSFLSWFSPTKMTELDLSSNAITGGQYKILNGSTNDIEFLPGLSAFANLVRLDLSYNQVSSIIGGQFKHLEKLLELKLSGNKVNLIGQAAFEMLVDQFSINKRFEIDLSENELTDEHFKYVHKTGLTSSKRPIYLNLARNNFKYISERNFKDFLLSHPQNKLNFTGNNLICNKDLEWMSVSSGTVNFKHQIHGAICSNDEGKTVWNSNLIR